LTKDLFDKNIFIWGKEIQIRIGKCSIKILKGLINFIGDLIGKKIILKFDEQLRT